MSSEKKPWDTSLADVLQEGEGFDGGMHFILHLPAHCDVLWENASFWPRVNSGVYRSSSDFFRN